MDDSFGSIEDDITGKKNQIGKELAASMERAKNTVGEVHASQKEAEQDGENTEDEKDPVILDD